MHLVDWHELEDGTQVQGFTECVGEQGVYKRKRRFGTVAEKETLIDNGQPQFDENQAEDNFKQTMKKACTSAYGSAIPAFCITSAGREKGEREGEGGG